MGYELEPENDEPAPPADRQEQHEPRTAHRVGHDGLPLPTLWAYRDGRHIVACCPACGDGHVYELDDMRDPIGSRDGYVRAPCEPIAEIGGAYVREARPGEHRTE